jgi:hypothetical protein
MLATSLAHSSDGSGSLYEGVGSSSPTRERRLKKMDQPRPSIEFYGALPPILFKRAKKGNRNPSEISAAIKTYAADAAPCHPSGQTHSTALVPVVRAALVLAPSLLCLSLSLLPRSVARFDPKIENRSAGRALERLLARASLCYLCIQTPLSSDALSQTTRGLDHTGLPNQSTRGFHRDVSPPISADLIGA